MASSKRISTVHDLSSLRLHPDGSRVTPTTGHTPRNAQYAVQDFRGNWIAKDAGGLGRVKQRWSARIEAKQQNENENEACEDESFPLAQTPSADKGKRRADDEDESYQEDSTVKDIRALRRRLFAEDLGFLEPPIYPTTAGPSSAKPELAAVPAERALTEPTSDLLKCIHYFASTYYNEMGQLQDTSREYRQEKKRRRLRRRQSEEAVVAGKSPSTDSPDPSLREAASSQESVRDTGAAASGDENESVEHSRESHRVNRRGKDMYKIFDGSALMAIGMLLQEHVTNLVSTAAAEDWQDSMLRLDVAQASTGPNRRKRKKSEHEQLHSESSQEETAQTTEGDESQYTDEQTYVPSDDIGAYDKAP